MMTAIVSNGEADLVAMSRPFIREPQLLDRWQAGKRMPTACLSCNGCMRRFRENEVVGCIRGERF